MNGKGKGKDEAHGKQKEEMSETRRKENQVLIRLLSVTYVMSQCRGDYNYSSLTCAAPTHTTHPSTYPHKNTNRKATQTQKHKKTHTHTQKHKRTYSRSPV